MAPIFHYFLIRPPNDVLRNRQSLLPHSFYSFPCFLQRPVIGPIPWFHLSSSKMRLSTHDYRASGANFIFFTSFSMDENLAIPLSKGLTTLRTPEGFLLSQSAELDPIFLINTELPSSEIFLFSFLLPRKRSERRGAVRGRVVFPFFHQSRRQEERDLQRSLADVERPFS